MASLHLPDSWQLHLTGGRATMDKITEILMKESI